MISAAVVTDSIIIMRDASPGKWTRIDMGVLVYVDLLESSFQWKKTVR